MSRNKANLEMTANDHLAIGSTPSRILKENPGKTLAETMDDQEIQRFILDEINTVSEMHEEAKDGKEVAINVFKVVLDEFLIPNIQYLRSIGRLPKEFTDLDPATKFAL